MKQKERDQSEEQKKRQARTVSIQEGNQTAIAQNLGDGSIITFVTELAQKTNPAKASLYVGAISAIASLVNPIAQIRGSTLLISKERKNVVKFYVGTQALLWLPLVVISIAFHFGYLSTLALYLSLAVYAAIAATGGFLYPAWFSWMGDIIPQTQRGKYFAKRNKINGFVGLGALLVGIGIIELAETLEYTLIGFALLFLCASFFRFRAYQIFKKQYAPQFKLKKKNEIRFVEFIKERTNYTRFVYYQMLFNGAIMIASPFYIVYMKQDLGLTYGMIMAIMFSSTGFYLLFTKFAGRFSDRYGNLKLMYLANICFIATPILWIMIQSPLLLILIPQLIAGLGNAAFILAATNFTYDAVPKEKRPGYIAQTNVLIGIGSFVGAAIGGILLSYVSITFMNKFWFMFLLAATTRLLVFSMFVPSLKEVKQVSALPIHFKLPFPLKALHHELERFIPHKKGSLPHKV